MKDADVYIYRGGAYLKLGQTERACNDFRKACALGDCEVFNGLKKKGVCQ